MLAESPGYEHHIIDRSEEHVVFLAKYPVAWGHVLVAPVEHREHVIADFSTEQFLNLHRAVHDVGRALTTVVKPERLYVLSLGSQQGNKHVHWHLVPLPPGVPYEEQQTALFGEAKGWLRFDSGELADLAGSIRQGMSTEMR